MPDVQTQQSSQPPPQAGGRPWRQVLDRMAPLGFLLVLSLLFGLLNRRFLTVDNLLNVAVQISVIAVVAIGETFVIVAAGIDLSVGSLVALTGVTCALLMKVGVANILLHTIFTLAARNQCQIQHVSLDVCLTEYYFAASSSLPLTI